MTKKIVLNGPVIPSAYQRVYDWFEQEAVSPSKVSALLENASGEELEIKINSPGGDVYSASEIYALLNEYPARIEVVITGLAASAATIIAMAGDVTKIYETAMFMIHNPSSAAQGDYRAMQKAADFLKNANEVVVAAYVNKTGKTKEELLDLMNNESWFSPQAALDAGFVDEIIVGKKNTPLAAVASLYPSLLVNSKADEFLAFLDTKSKGGATHPATYSDGSHNHKILPAPWISTESTSDNVLEKNLLEAKFNLLKLKGKREKV